MFILTLSSVCPKEWTKETSHIKREFYGNVPYYPFSMRTVFLKVLLCWSLLIFTRPEGSLNISLRHYAPPCKRKKLLWNEATWGYETITYCFFRLQLFVLLGSVSSIYRCWRYQSQIKNGLFHRHWECCLVYCCWWIGLLPKYNVVLEENMEDSLPCASSSVVCTARRDVKCIQPLI